MKRWFIFILVLVMPGYKLFASGFQVYLQGNRQTAMANIGVSLRPDASSIFFNPGALSMMEGNSILFGGNLITSNITYWNSQEQGSNYTAKTESALGTPFHLYGAFGNGKLKFGIGVYTPFGSGVDWENGWQGQYLLEELTLQSIFFQPTLSYRVTERFSIGGGFVYSTGSVNLKRALPISSQNPSNVELDGSASGIGYNIGLFFKPSEKLNFGLSYRSKVEMEVEKGDAIFNVPSSLRSFFPEGNKFDATLPLPSVATVGVSYLPDDILSVSFEANLVGWGAYEALSFDFETNTPRVADSRSPRDYENSWIFKIGAEYKIADPLQLRAGVYYDQTPVQDGYMTPETPDADRTGLTVGLGYSIGESLQLDLSFLYINGQEREQTVEDATNAGTYKPSEGVQHVLPGTYKLNAIIPGLSVSYKF